MKALSTPVKKKQETSCEPIKTANRSAPRRLQQRETQSPSAPANRSAPRRLQHDVAEQRKSGALSEIRRRGIKDRASSLRTEHARVSRVPRKQEEAELVGLKIKSSSLAISTSCAVETPSIVLDVPQIPIQLPPTLGCDDHPQLSQWREHRFDSSSALVFALDTLSIRSLDRLDRFKEADLVVAGCEAELARRIGLRIDAIISKLDFVRPEYKEPPNPPPPLPLDLVSSSVIANVAITATSALLPVEGQTMGVIVDEASDRSRHHAVVSVVSETDAEHEPEKASSKNYAGLTHVDSTEEDVTTAHLRRLKAQLLSESKVATTAEPSSSWFRFSPSVFNFSPTGKSMINSVSENKIAGDSVDVYENDVDADEAERERNFSMFTEHGSAVVTRENLTSLDSAGNAGSASEVPRSCITKKNIPSVLSVRKLASQGNEMVGTGGESLEEALLLYREALDQCTHLALMTAARIEALATKKKQAAQTSPMFSTISVDLNREESRLLSLREDESKIRNNAAAVLHRLKRHGDALEEFTKVYESKVATLGPLHCSVGHTLVNIAGLMMDDNRPSDAEFYYRNALLIYEACYGVENSLCENVRWKLSHVSGL